MDLPTFLLQCIAEDESVANSAISGARPDWVVGCEETSNGENAFWSVEALGEESEWFADLGSKRSDHARAVHIVRWGPARVLAECLAKRNIVQAYLDERARRDVYQSADARATEDDEQVVRRRSSAARCRGLEIAVEYLAQVYADRPGFREEWKL